MTALSLVSGSRWRPRLASVLGVVTGAVLLLAGFTAGIVGGLALSWLAWIGESGSRGAVLAFGSALLYLVLLFVGCRLGASGMEARSGAALPAGGWALANLLLISYSPGDDIIVSDSLVNYVLLFGGVLAVTLATVTAPAPRPRPASSARPEREDLLAEPEEQRVDTHGDEGPERRV